MCSMLSHYNKHFFVVVVVVLLSVCPNITVLVDWA